MVSRSCKTGVPFFLRVRRVGTTSQLVAIFTDFKVSRINGFVVER